MKTFLFILLTFSFSLFADDCRHNERNFRCVKFIKNYDADTVTFDIPGIHPMFGKKLNVRVSGVDTPELRTKNRCEKEKARHAKKLVTNLLKNAKRIDLINLERGKYFRLVAEVMVDGKSLSEYLLKNGLGYGYQGGTKKKMDWCRSLRDIASENEMGK